jgi:hypothetical protein
MKPEVPLPYCKQEQATSPGPDLTSQFHSVPFPSDLLQYAAVNISVL